MERTPFSARLSQVPRHISGKPIEGGDFRAQTNGERYGGTTEPFGGTITHHHMPPNTVAARVAYLWRGKDKRASLTGVHLIGVHPRRAS